MLNPALDVEHWRAALARDGRVQVDDWLAPDAAAAIAACLANEVSWTLAVEDGSGARKLDHPTYAAMDAAACTALYAAAAASARHPAKGDTGFRFAYDTYMMVEAYKAGRDPQLLLHRVLEALNAPPTLALLRALTGEPRIRRASAQASRYRPGQFLRQHTDHHSGEGRLYAYVINLSRDWQPDWGGLLQFIDGGRVVDTFVPRYNTLSLFKVPAHHAVSLVAPWAPRDRLSVTGWLLL